MYLKFSQKIKKKINILRNKYKYIFRIMRKNLFKFYIKKYINNINKYNLFINLSKNKINKFKIRYNKNLNLILSKNNKKKINKTNYFFLNYLRKKYNNISFFFINILLFIKSISKLMKNKKEKMLKNKLIRYNYHKINIKFFFFELFKNANQTEWSFLICFFIFFKIIPYNYLKNFKGFIFKFFFIKSIFNIKNMFNYIFFLSIKKKTKSLNIFNKFLNFEKFKKEKKFVYSNFFIKFFYKKFNKKIRMDLKKVVTLKNYYIQNKFKKLDLSFYKKERNIFFNRRIKFFFFKKFKKDFIKKNLKKNVKKNKALKENRFAKIKDKRKKIVSNYIENYLKINLKKKNKYKNSFIFFFRNKFLNNNKNNKKNYKNIFIIKRIYYLIKFLKKLLNNKLYNFIDIRFYNSIIEINKHRRYINNIFFYNYVIAKNYKKKHIQIFNKYDKYITYKQYILYLKDKNNLYLQRILFNFKEKNKVNNFLFFSLKLNKNKIFLKNIILKKYRINNVNNFNMNKKIKKKKIFEKNSKSFQNQSLFSELNILKIKEKKLHYTLYVQIKRKNLFLTAFDHSSNRIILKQSLGTCYIITDVTDKKKIKKYKQKIMIKKLINVYNNYIYKGLKKINIRIVALKNTSEVKFIVSKLLFSLSKIKNRKICLLNISYLNKKCHNGCRLKKKRRLKKRQSIY